MRTKFWSENRKERQHSEDGGIFGRIISEWIFRELGLEYVDWMHQTLDRDRWRFLVNTVIMNLPVL
jgi:hypothetical protein